MQGILSLVKRGSIAFPITQARDGQLAKAVRGTIASV